MSCRRSLVLSILSWLAPVAASADPVGVSVINRSSWTVEHATFSVTQGGRWSADVLGGRTIRLGDSFTFEVPSCDHYDLRIVDPEANECVIEGLELCSDMSSWVLTNDALRECEGG